MGVGEVILMSVRDKGEVGGGDMVLILREVAGGCTVDGVGVVSGSTLGELLKWGWAG